MNIIKRFVTNIRDCAAAAKQGEPLPILMSGLIGKVRPMPDSLKRLTLQHHARRHKVKVFVETGTFRGDTLAFLLPTIDELHSIELSPDFHAAAKERFRNEPSVHLHCGDSGRLLREVLPKIEGKALLWLDAHYSGKNTAKGESETPIMAELKAAFAAARTRHIIFIDDSHYFGSNADYPSLEEVENLARNHGYTFEHRYGLLRLLAAD